MSIVVTDPFALTYPQQAKLVAEFTLRKPLPPAIKHSWVYRSTDKTRFDNYDDAEKYCQDNGQYMFQRGFGNKPVWWPTIPFLVDKKGVRLFTNGELIRPKYGVPIPAQDSGQELIMSRRDNFNKTFKPKPMIGVPWYVARLLTK